MSLSEIFNESLSQEKRELSLPIICEVAPSRKEIYNWLDEVNKENLFLRDEFRNQFIEKYGFSIPTQEAVDWIKENSNNLIEIGGGSGYWARLLECETTDLNEESVYDFKISKDAITMSAEDVVESHDGDVFVSWACYSDEWLHCAVLQMNKGSKLFVIGEGRGGCTATDGFFDEVCDESRWKRIEVPSEAQIPSFRFIRDYLAVYERI